MFFGSGIQAKDSVLIYHQQIHTWPKKAKKKKNYKIVYFELPSLVESYPNLPYCVKGTYIHRHVQQNSFASADHKFVQTFFV